MAKASREKPTKVEIQKGPINLDEQFTQKFMGRVQCTIEDLHHADMRRSKQTLTLHEPKR